MLIVKLTDIFCELIFLGCLKPEDDCKTLPCQ